jgi:hypothetical protein
MNALNAYPCELGYDWKTHTIKTIDAEMKRYQYEMLGLNNTQTQNLVGYYLKTLFWITDYYMNTYSNQMNTNDMISTWSYNFPRAPFINHINLFFSNNDNIESAKLLKNTYKRSLVPISQYIGSDKHQLYIYPQSDEVLASLPEKYKINFPDMKNYVDSTFKTMEHVKNGQENQENQKNQKNQDNAFDCRNCPYFSKCLFKSKNLSYKELMGLDLNVINKSPSIKSPSIKSPSIKSSKSSTTAKSLIAT